MWSLHRLEYRGVWVGPEREGEDGRGLHPTCRVHIISRVAEGVSGKVLAAGLANLGASSRGPSPAVTQPLGGPGSSDEPQLLNMPRRDFRGSYACSVVITGIFLAHHFECSISYLTASGNSLYSGFLTRIYESLERLTAPRLWDLSHNSINGTISQRVLVPQSHMSLLSKPPIVLGRTDTINNEDVGKVDHMSVVGQNPVQTRGCIASIRFPLVYSRSSPW